MVELGWTKVATNDLQEIFDFITEDSKRYAELTVSKLYIQTQQLKENPKIGRVVPEFNEPNIRELIVNSYRIVYKILDKAKLTF